MVYYIKNVLYFLCIWLMCQSCTEFPDCQNPEISYARGVFINKITNQLESVNFDKITIVDNGDTVARGDTLRLPLNPFKNETTYRFTSEVSEDILTISYESKTRILAPECGPYQYFFNINVASTTFDSVVVNSNIANLNLPLNVSIYR